MASTEKCEKTRTGDSMNSTKAGLTVIVGLFAVVAGVYSMMEPMGLRVDDIAKDVADIRLSMGLDDIREREDKGELAGMQEKFKKIETQFDGLQRLLDQRLSQLEKDSDRNQEWKSDHDLRVRGLNAAQWERIRALERRVYGTPLPISIGAGAGSDIE